METYGVLSLIPPIIAICLAFKTKNVFTALFTAIFAGCVILSGWNPVMAVQTMFDTMVGVFASANNVKSIFAVLIVGGMIKLIESMGGVEGLIRLLVQKRSIIKSQKGALLLTWLIGVLVFTTGGMSILVTGTVSAPICKAMKIAPEKNALIVHATSSPVTVAIPFSAMGAFTIGYLGSMAAAVGGSPNVYYEALPYFFTPLIFIFGTLAVILTGFDFPLMKKKIKEYESVVLKEVGVEQQEVAQRGKAVYLILPMVLLVVCTLVFMVISGNGNFLKGDGMAAFLFAAFISMLVTIAMALKDKLFTLDESVNIFIQGCGNMIPIAMILMCAYTFGTLTGVLGTGAYLGGILGGFLPKATIPLMIYIIAAAISMATGSLAASANTIAPIAIPMAAALGVPLPIAVGAVYSSATVGDCASMISDNTILTCSTTKCDVMSHVRTQLPYALANAAVSSILFLILGFVM